MMFMVLVTMLLLTIILRSWFMQMNDLGYVFFGNLFAALGQMIRMLTA